MASDRDATRRQKPNAGPGRSDPGCTVTVCRGCCCGQPAKNPHVDHAGQLDRLRTGLAATGRLRTSDCLDVCDQQNVVVVNPSRRGRAAGGSPMWLGLVNDDAALDDVIAWVHAGGPGLAEPPVALSLYEFRPSRRIREAAELP